MDVSAANIQEIEASWLTEKELILNVLRLDKIHPVISGNKWFKLKYHLQDAIEMGKTTVATFGGAWSNHIVATACACNEHSLKSVGIIRGEEPPQLSATLQMAQQYGMELHFVTRALYREKELLKAKLSNKNFYWINEGGYGSTGAKGASEIVSSIDSSRYTHIIAAVGTGTMLAGIINAASNHQQILGISSMKGNTGLKEQITALINNHTSAAMFRILHDYHFGGYGKHPPVLIQYMNQVYQQFNLPLDIVYTAKTFYAIEDLAAKSFFEPGSKLLMIHSGGVQGNKGLKHKLLAF